MKPKLPDKPLSKTDRKALLVITAKEVKSAVAKTRRSMIALVQSDVE